MIYFRLLSVAENSFLLGRFHFSVQLITASNSHLRNSALVGLVVMRNSNKRSI